MALRIEFDNLAQLYQEAARHYGGRPAFATRGPEKRYEAVTYRQLHDQGAALATALLDLGVGPGEHVGLLGDNRFEWILTDCAVQLCGAADVPRGTDVTDGEIAYILAHADVRVVFVEDAPMAERVQRLRDLLPLLRHIIVMERADATPAGSLSLYDLLEQGRELRERGDRRVEERAAAVSPEDLFTLVYTSGTTGTPKGVMLTHANIVSQIRNVPLDITAEDRAVAILPIWHAFERVVEMVLLAHGATIYYSSLRSLREDLAEVRPTFLASAPRLWESFYQSILRSVEKGPPARRRLFRVAYACARLFQGSRRFLAGRELDLEGRSRGRTATLGLWHLVRAAVLALPHWVLDRLVLSRVRTSLGGRLRGSLSGGGALPTPVDEFFNTIGVPILEGYGMTETSPIIAMRTFRKLVIGTVGPVFPGTRLRLVDPDTGRVLYPPRRGVRGEIHVQGPQVMKGYFRDPQATARVLAEGWLNTGDLGLMTFNDCLRIAGRSKDTIVLLGGENVEPAPLENRLRESPLIDQCMVVGQDRKWLGALVVPDQVSLKQYGDSLEALAHSEEARRAVLEEVKRLTAPELGLKPYERVVECRLVPKPFEVGDELTNLYKLRRQAIAEKYSRLIDSLYR